MGARPGFGVNELVLYPQLKRLGHIAYTKCPNFNRISVKQVSIRVATPDRSKGRIGRIGFYYFYLESL